MYKYLASGRNKSYFAHKHTDSNKTFYEFIINIVYWWNKQSAFLWVPTVFLF